MRRINMYMNADHWRQLESVGKPEGLTPSHLIRISVAQFLSRERRKQATLVIVPGGKRRQAVIEQ